jgi:hypothetical protein
MEHYAIIHRPDIGTELKCDIVQALGSCEAEDTFMDKNPDREVVWMVDTDNVDDAFDAYHQESTMSD